MNILRHVLQILLLVSLSTQALGATDCNCGWRSQGVLISAEKGDPPTTSDMRQLRNDLNYVKKNYVDSWRTDQGAFRFEMQFLRLADTIPIIGGLGLGNDLKDWQIEQLDKQLAAWTAYGLQKIKSEGKLKLTSPKDRSAGRS